MRFGCCVVPELLETAARAGYDFVELSTEVLRPEKGEADFRTVQARLAEAPIRAEAWEIALPSGTTVCGPSVDWPRVSRYVSTALRRVAAAGGAVASFPCSEGCQTPAGFPESDARAQLSDFLRVCGAIARGHGLIVGIEPLAGEGGRVLGSLPEAMELARELNMPELGVVPNCFRMARADDPPLDVADASAWLAYAHVSLDDLDAGRGGDGYLQEFAQALRLADYGGRIAVQGEWPDPAEELARALEAMRSSFGSD